MSVAETLKSFTATFYVQRNIIPLGELTLTLNLTEHQYTYTAHSQPSLMAGLFSRNEVFEKSQGEWRRGKIIPHHYQYFDKNDATDNSDVVFDWKHLQADTSSRGVTWSQSIPNGTQDKLSQQLQVRLHLEAGQELMTYQVADGGKLKMYQFQVDGQESIDTPYGDFDCLRVSHRKESGPIDYTIWFAPSLDYLPVRIERTRGSRIYRMVLTELLTNGD
jgi:hypothetical protein